MKNEIMTKTTELTEAMVTVLRATYKRDVKPAFKLVEAAGYEVYKCDGEWYIRNTKTWKCIHIIHRYGARYGENTLSLSGYSRADLTKVDMIAYLNTPFNRSKYENEYAPSRGKIDRFTFMKYWLEESEKDMRKKERELEEAREYYIRKMKEITVFRAQNGLLK